MIWAWAGTASNARANRGTHRRVMARPREEVGNGCRLAEASVAGQGGCRGCAGWGRLAGGANRTARTVVALPVAWYRDFSLSGAPAPMAGLDHSQLPPREARDPA